MKRWFLSLWLLLCSLGLMQPAAALAGQDISVTMNGLPISFDVKPMMQNDRTLVPFRALAEALHVGVTWEAANQTIQAQNGSKAITLQIGNQTANLNGAPVSLDVPPQIINGRTLVPLRFFSESFNCSVTWNQVDNEIAILSPSKLEVIGFYALGDQKTSSWTNLFGTTFPEVAKGNTDLVKTLALGWYSLDQEGNLLTKSTTGWQRPDSYEQVLAAAKDLQLKTQMVIHVTDEQRVLTNLLANEAAMQQAVSDIVQEAKNYRGVNLNLEGLGLTDQGEQLTQVRASFVTFVSLLSQELKSAQVTLSLTIHAPNSSYRGYDYQKLAPLVDEIIIMAYDYGSKPEPVQLVEQAVQQAKAMVPAEKLVLGISLPSENETSLLTKVAIAQRYELKGIALWRLGLVSQDMWSNLKTTITTEAN
ncbi:stalk domain-containing protein [Desulforamulus aeronauticus]|uniref:Glycosyl hydrolases family 18 n=1 Tax=Desulforamulus aeronauticus DSM 10349 TaxID=1121421 RepID=A0A1M6PM26_9FIRM|nr:stalk domain-containing protein [Desulforamulus aeronauticus]SHK08917.1 Glycosyl hydrolases family 18 [Desulforamulus aeronauticus DSM 10349]